MVGYLNRHDRRCSGGTRIGIGILTIVLLATKVIGPQPERSALRTRSARRDL